ncbi:hypothetical protein CERSUDRAFT_87237 [Gelatoporia subvermispora B]|uniref:Uncharacterized protein n=1 Tax=Ceriporiopsis subvermispora (strain B) TaxID=914234 RepID=M2QMG8_CERS8|nr:hypothetical protein CERSUDRAFT_87237 [Gelatoporia subvermispora B]
MSIGHPWHRRNVRMTSTLEDRRRVHSLAKKKRTSSALAFCSLLNALISPVKKNSLFWGLRAIWVEGL